MSRCIRAPCAGFQQSGIRGQGDNEDVSQESLWCQEAGYLLHHYVLQHRDPLLLHTLMSSQQRLQVKSKL